MKVFVGTSGWNYNHWREKFYPKSLPQNKWLEFYSDFFDTVELNMSFYRFPSREMIFNWKEEMPRKFKMTLKANQLITHIKRFKNPEDNLTYFYSLADILKNQFGCILFQAPPSFKFNENNFERIKSFTGFLDKNKRNIFEFREANWWNKDVFDFFKKEKVYFCSISRLGFPEDFIDGKIGYIRFHNYKYSKMELRNWARKIKKAKAKEIYCYFNNDQKAYAIQNALTLKLLI